MTYNTNIHLCLLPLCKSSEEDRNIQWVKVESLNSVGLQISISFDPFSFYDYMNVTSPIVIIRQLKIFS